MGLIMKKTSGKVNPGITNIVLREELEKLELVNKKSRH